VRKLWAFAENRIAVRFACQWHDDMGQWSLSYCYENWEFSDDGLMSSRFASINDIPILGSKRKGHWVLGRRPDDNPGVKQLYL
jgi:nuclear transport factor 2 (NTF2) superfamily protein